MRDLYASAGEDARFTHPVAAPFLVIPMAILAIIAGVVGAVAAGAIYGFQVGASGATPEQTQAAAYSIVGFLVTFFPAFAALSIFWAKVFERRSLASMGFRGFAPWLWLRGLVVGALLALALSALGAFVAQQLGLGEEMETSIDWALLQHPMILQFLAITALIFSVQSASEEIVIRGWLYSSMFARAAFPVALLVSSVVFGLLHSDRLFVNFTGGLIGLVALSTVGIFLALYATIERSVWGVSGVHGGFNATLICAMFAGLYTQSGGEASGLDLITEAMGSIQEQLTSDVAGPVSLVQFALFGVVSLAILGWARRALRARGL